MTRRDLLAWGFALAAVAAATVSGAAHNRELSKQNVVVIQDPLAPPVGRENTRLLMWRDGKWERF